MKAQKVWFENGRINILTDDGRAGCLPVRLFPRLYNATEAQRRNYTLSHFGIHWPDIDEDLSYDGFFHEDTPQHPENAVGRIFSEYPELNARQVARIAGINTTLFQQYIDGHKKPSVERLQQIESAIHRLGAELSALSIR